MGDSTRLRRLAAKKLGLCGVAAFTTFSLSGCSADKVLDAINPVNWYHDVTGTSASDKAAAQNPNAANYAAGSDQPYPNLDSVPGEPSRGLTEEQKEKLTEGLLADREHARYTDQQIRSGNGGASMPPLASLPQGDQGPMPTTISSGGLAAGSALGVSDAPSPDIPRETPAPPVIKPVPPPQPTKLADSAAASHMADVPVPAAPAPPPAPPSAQNQPAAKPGRKNSALVTQLVFAPGSNALPSSAPAALATVAAKHKEVGGIIRIVGYAASVAGSGADPAGEKLAVYQAALGRATALKLSLVDAGVPAAEIVAQAAQATTASSDTNADRADIYVDY